MKVFYRKEYQTGKIKELLFYASVLSNGASSSKDLLEVVIYSSFIDPKGSFEENSSTFKELLRKTYIKSDYANMLRLLRVRLMNYGWKETYEEALESTYATYPDGKDMCCRIAKSIDSLESIDNLIPVMLPTYMYVKPVGCVDTFFDGQFRNLNFPVNNLLLAKAKYVLDALRVPFNCYVAQDSDELIVFDVMLLNTDYTSRLRILQEVKHRVKVIEPEMYSFKELLWRDYNKIVEQDSSVEIVLAYAKSKYIPGTSMQYSYMVTPNNYEEAIVLDIDTENKEALCLDFSMFDTLFQLKIEDEEMESLHISSIVQYKEEMNAVTTKI